MGDLTLLFAGRRWRLWRIAMWGSAAFLLLLPAIAMRFTAEVNWTASDFVVMGAMLAAACGACELAASASENGSYRLAALVAIGAAFLTVWANLAVGMIGSEDSAYNLLFGGVIGIGLVGAILAELRPAGMAKAMAAAAIAQGLVSAFGLPADTRGAVFSMAFALPWLVSALLFRKAEREIARPIASGPA